MAKRLKWLTLSPLATEGASGAFNPELPNDISFTIKKPFFTASVVLSYRLSAEGSSPVGHSSKNYRVVAETSLQAKIPVMGNINYSIRAISVPLFANEAPENSGSDSDITNQMSTSSTYFAFESCLESDDAKGNYRKVVTHGKTLRLESPKLGSEPDSKVREIEIVPPSPLLVHLLALPALIASREAETDIYVAQLVNGLKIRALRLDRISVTASAETYRGRVVSVSSELTEEEFRDLPWEHATSFEFDFDLTKNMISAARIQLPIIGKIEIK